MDEDGGFRHAAGTSFNGFVGTTFDAGGENDKIAA